MSENEGDFGKVHVGRHVHVVGAIWVAVEPSIGPVVRAGGEGLKAGLDKRLRRGF